jgi:phosphoribosylamine--glycine ligase / phosphoribosylformylglycinamidine cyclo-ligase
MFNAKLKVLLIGSGGREHAFAWSLSKSSLVEKVICIPGNGGTARGDPKIENGPVSLTADDYPGLVNFAKSRGINLVVPSSEGPLVDGIERYFRDEGIVVFGPTEEAARLEGSKCAAKDFMSRHGIPTAEYKNFRDFETAKEYLGTVTHPVVIKASGLAGGKGVLMPTNREENLAALRSLMVDKIFGKAGMEVVIEERLLGDEISITFLTDGYDLRMFPAGQDAQRILDGNLGANTGGMGVYAPTPLLTAEQLHEIERTILQPTVDGIREEGKPSGVRILHIADCSFF